MSVISSINLDCFCPCFHFAHVHIKRFFDCVYCGPGSSLVCPGCILLCYFIIIAYNTENYFGIEVIKVYHIQFLIRFYRRPAPPVAKCNLRVRSVNTKKLCIPLIPLFFWNTEYFDLLWCVRHTEKNSVSVKIQRFTYLTFCCISKNSAFHRNSASGNAEFQNTVSAERTLIYKIYSNQHA